MWTPQAIVAVILALAIILAFSGAIASRFLGFEPSEKMTDMWQSILGMLIGGLVAWIGTEKNGKD